MVKVFKDSVLPEDIIKLQEEYPGYIKVVVDLRNNWIAAGGEYHVDCEQLLADEGSSHADMWGGGYSVSTKEVDYFAMSNYRPADGRVTYEIADQRIRNQFKIIVESFFNK